MNVEPQPGRKFVWYYGRKLEIPKDHYYVATDENGLIWSYKYQPVKNTNKQCWDCVDESFEECICQISVVRDYESFEEYICRISVVRDRELAERWQDTLVEYPTDYEFTEKKQ